MKAKIEASIQPLTTHFAVGNDLVFLPDFKRSFNALFKQKVYTQQEIDYCEQFDQSILRYASTWAAKEAVYKGIKQLQNVAIGFKQIEIIRTKPSGKPTVNFPDKVNNKEVSLTITHDGDYVWAIAIFNKNAS